MHELTSQGEQAVADLSARYGVSTGAVRALLEAVQLGNGTMAQFSHPELGGRGQWMAGGMTMVGDMFSPGLQARVSGLAGELSSLLASTPVYAVRRARPGPAQLTRRIRGRGGRPSWDSPDRADARTAPVTRCSRRPGGLPCRAAARPSASTARWTMSFTACSSRGASRARCRSPASTARSPSRACRWQALTAARCRPGPGPPRSRSCRAHRRSPPPSGPSGQAVPSGTDADAVLAVLERLGDLHRRGVLTDEEFAAKKAEILSRL